MKKNLVILCIFFSTTCTVPVIGSADVTKKLSTMLNTAIKDNDPVATLTLLKVFEELGISLPAVNLCRLKIDQPHLFCQRHLKIKRIDMPQLSGRPRPGSKAAQLPVDDKGYVNAANPFKHYLMSKGYTLLPKRIPAKDLQATQDELIGSKVASIWWGLKINPYNPFLREPLFISKDNYILDGHHRWAAQIGMDFEDAKLGDILIDTIQVNANMKDLVGIANRFADEFGILPEVGVGK